MNGVSATDLCLDMGVSLKRAVALQTDVVQRIGELGGLTPDALATMLSWTGEQAGEVRTRLRGEVFVSRAVRNPVVRGCPVCLRTDGERHRGAPVEAMAMRGDWQLREASLCLRHAQPLVPLWREATLTGRYDTGSRLTEIQASILSGRLDRPRSEASPYDLWLDRRLEDGHDQTWLADQPLYAATTVCRLLGTELLRAEGCEAHDERGSGEAEGEGVEIDGEDAQRVLRAGQAAGFDVLRRGEGALRAALDRLAATCSGTRAEPRKAFGQLFMKLNTDHRGDPAFEAARRVLRACILDTWPIAAGEEVLGETLPARRLHSVGSAALESGVHVGVLGRLLVEAGALASQSDRLDGRRTFDAQAHANLLAEIAALVRSQEMRKAMGATIGELASLEVDGVLRPWSEDALLKARWRAAGRTSPGGGAARAIETHRTRSSRLGAAPAGASANPTEARLPN